MSEHVRPAAARGPARSRYISFVAGRDGLPTVADVSDLTSPEASRPQIAGIEGGSSLNGVTGDSYNAGASGVPSPPMSPVNAINPVGAKLTAARERAGLSKYRLARLAGVHEWQIRLWERGDHVPSVPNLLKLLPHLGGTLEDYLV